MKIKIDLDAYSCRWLLGALEEVDSIIPNNELNQLILAILGEFKAKHIAKLYLADKPMNRLTIKQSEAIAISKLCQMVLAKGYRAEPYLIVNSIDPYLLSIRNEHILN